MKTKQQIFDQVVDHLLTQKVQSMGEYDTCKYRMTLDDGKVLKCAVGCLIPDDKYHPNMEGDVHHLMTLINGSNYIGEIAIANPNPEVFTDENESFLQDLQYIHDKDNSTVLEWASDLQDYAEKIGLEYRGVIE